jgi:hypothetical protein
MLRWTTDPPELERPVLLVALEGFVDAGGVATSAAMFLRHRWQSDVVALFDPDSLIDYRARRPTAVVDSGHLRRLDWPAIELCAATVEGPHDALLLVGPEPDMRWQAFVDEVVEVCRHLEVEAVIGLGAYPAAVPHTRPTTIVKASGSLDPGLELLVAEVAGYTGPVGISVALQHGLGEADIPSVGVWAEVPHYIAASPFPAGALAMVRLVSQALGTEVDATELEAAATLHREQVDEAVAEHAEAVEMVAALEQHVDSGGRSETLPTGEDLADEIERYLRAQEG